MAGREVYDCEDRRIAMGELPVPTGIHQSTGEWEPVPMLAVCRSWLADRLIAVTSVVAQRGQRVQACSHGWRSAETSSQIARAGNGTAAGASFAWRHRPIVVSTRRNRSCETDARLRKSLEAALSARASVSWFRAFRAWTSIWPHSTTRSKGTPRRRSRRRRRHLQKAAAQWEQITDAHGRDAQRAGVSETSRTSSEP